MPRNIRSLSLAPLVATTPPCAHSTAQLPTAMSPCPPPLANRSPVLVQQTSTVFRQGLITPTTPCYFLPKITTSSSSNDTSSNTTTTTAITITTTTTTSTAIQTDHQQPRSVAMPACPLDADRTPESPDAGDDTDCDCSFSFEDFEKRYVPLSHLPTPPHLLACVAIDSRAPQGPVNTEFWGASHSPHRQVNADRSRASQISGEHDSAQRVAPVAVNRCFGWHPAARRPTPGRRLAGLLRVGLPVGPLPAPVAPPLPGPRQLSGAQRAAGHLRPGRQHEVYGGLGPSLDPPSLSLPLPIAADSSGSHIRLGHGRAASVRTCLICRP